MKLTKRTAVTCAKCGRVDVNDERTIPRYTGTAQMMLCPDCGHSPGGVYPSARAARRAGYAQLCRYCCPTGHGTRPPV